MKKILIIVLLVAVILFGRSVIINGFSGPFDLTINSYAEVGKKSDDLTMEIANYNKNNESLFQTALSQLDNVIGTYEKNKDSYNELVDELSENGELTEEKVLSAMSGYEIAFLWTEIGNYAKEEGLVIKLKVKKTETTELTKTLGYGLYTLEFTIEDGSYVGISDFLYKLEEDDRLAFEIRNYYMTSGSTATFSIYNVLLNNATIHEIIDEVEVEEPEEQKEPEVHWGTANQTTDVRDY